MQFQATDFVLDALEQTLYARQPNRDDALIQSRRQGLAIRPDPLHRLATSERVSWFNSYRLMEPLGYTSPAKAEANFYRKRDSLAPIPA